MNIVKLSNLSYQIHKRTIFNGIELSIVKNECIAITGNNGVGKSTLLKIIAGLILPTKGKVHSSAKRLSYVPEHPPKLLRFTTDEYLTHMGKIQGLQASIIEERITGLIKLFNLEDYQFTRLNRLSKGNKQKVNMIQALLPSPDLLLLDEPLSGLDINAQRSLVSLLHKLKGEGTTIMFTCHETFLIEKLADRHIHIVKGNIKTVQSANSSRYYRQLEFLAPSVEDVVRIRKKIDCITYTNHSSFHRIIVNAEKSDEIIKTILNNNGMIQFVSHQLHRIPNIKEQQSDRLGDD